MDDWQEAAFNNRRLPHGRSKKGGKASGRSGAGTFDPKQALGTYELSGTVIDRLVADAADGAAVFDIHELTETPGGMVGSLVIPNGVCAAVLLAGSRKLVTVLVEAAESTGTAEASHSEDDEDLQSDASGVNSAETEQEAADRKANERILAFEKNSFKAPKFWLRWQGDVTNREGNAVRERNQGYVVFTGNDCKAFQGTLSCKGLGWKDVAVQGRKATSKPRAAGFAWTEMDVNGGEDEDGDRKEDDDVAQ